MTPPVRAYHAAPLHYIPHVIRDGALYARSVLQCRNVAGRGGRDNRLGLADYVHFSLQSDTPLLADKLRRGYPHALFVFDGEAVFRQPGVALLPFNTKAWRHRSAYAPVTDSDAQAHLLRAHAAGRFPSLEVLIPYGLRLDCLMRLVCFTDAESAALAAVLSALDLPAPLAADPSLFPACPTYAPTTGDALSDYFAACIAAKDVLPPPPIPFD